MLPCVSIFFYHHSTAVGLDDLVVSGETGGSGGVVSACVWRERGKHGGYSGQ